MHIWSKERNKQQLEEELEINGIYVRRNARFYILLLTIVSVFEILMFIQGTRRTPSFKKTMYLASYILLCSASLLALPFLILASLEKLRNRTLGIVLNLYAFFVMVWAGLISIIDVIGGNYPVVFLTISFSVGGLVMINPYAHMAMVLTGTLLILLFDRFAASGYFFHMGPATNLFVFIGMVYMVTFRQHRLLKKEYKHKRILENLSYRDQLTGLGNETLYFAEIEKLQKQIDKGQDVKFAVAVMDVNNVKATNDAYGHRYGCNLIVTAGKTLPSVFPTSSLFHLGGDEFVAILMGEDYENIAVTLDHFQEKLHSKKIVFEGKELHLSVALGYSLYMEGLKYSDVFQKADDDMYLNKKEMKKELGLSER